MEALPISHVVHDDNRHTGVNRFIGIDLGNLESKSVHHRKPISLSSYDRRNIYTYFQSSAASNHGYSGSNLFHFGYLCDGSQYLEKKLGAKNDNPSIIAFGLPFDYMATKTR